jgi:hypothetical protein
VIVPLLYLYYHISHISHLSHLPFIIRYTLPCILVLHTQPRPEYSSNRFQLWLLDSFALFRFSLRFCVFDIEPVDI